MSKNELKKTADTLAVAENLLQRLLSQQDRCETVKTSGLHYDAQIKDLKSQRNKAIGEAFLANTSADLSEINAQIIEMEMHAENELKAAQAAEEAIGLLVPRINAARDDIAAAREAHNASLAEGIKSVFNKAEQDYHSAACALKVALAQMGGAANLLKTVSGYGPLMVVENIISSLSGTGRQGECGLIIKHALNSQWLIDRHLQIGRLSPEIEAAMCEIKTDLVKLGAQL